MQEKECILLVVLSTINIILEVQASKSNQKRFAIGSITFKSH